MSVNIAELIILGLPADWIFRKLRILGLIICGLTARSAGVLLCLIGSRLNRKERLLSDDGPNEHTAPDAVTESESDEPRNPNG